jgi:HK97 family phage prohead protease
MSQRYVYAVSGQVEGRTLSGVVHVYGSVTTDERRHSFARGAFAKSIAAGEVKSFAWHGDRTVALLGSQRAGTLRLEDGDELRFSLDLPETSDGNDLRVLKERGEEIGMSFQVVPLGRPVRRGGVTTWAEGRLLSVDPVAMPAFEGTNVQLNSAQAGEPAHSAAIKIHARILAQL